MSAKELKEKARRGKERKKQKKGKERAKEVGKKERGREGGEQYKDNIPARLSLVVKGKFYLI